MKKRKRWLRDEALYNEVQESEFLNFFEFVRFLTNKVCKNSKMKSVITCLIVWHKFPNLTIRRARGFLLLLKKYKIIKFKPALSKEKLKKIWQQCDFYLNVEKEWRNFLDICENNKDERNFALNNFLITEFLITHCGLKPKMLNKINCHCDQTSGEIKILNENYNKHKQPIKKFLINLN